ncbi:MAG: Na/Pi cotransporter family protein, partial [Rubripirellula sp.]
FQADNYLGVLKCAMVGCILTTMVQSSSATLGITISLASSGVISFETAAALVLGENIGTTITAFLASLGATTNARRAAYFHVIFNILGVLWITAIFQWYVQLVPTVVDVDVNALVMAESSTGPVETFPNRTVAIAATHTIFNITNTLLFLPFVGIFVRFLQWLVPAKDFKEKPRLTDLDIRMLETPLLAIEQSQKELERMGDGCTKMLGWLSELIMGDEPHQAVRDRLRKREQVLDSIEDEISVFVTHLLSGNIPHAVADEARHQLRLADEYESVSDYITNLEKFDRKLRRDGHRFTKQQQADIVMLCELTSEYIEAINQGLAQKNSNVLMSTEQNSKRIRDEIKRLRRKHLEDLSGGNMAPLVTVAYLAVLNAFARVRDHSYNISQTIAGER